MAQSNSRFELVLAITSSYFGDILISNKTFWDIVARYWKYPGDINIFWYKFAFASLLIFMPISKRSGFSDLEFRSGALRLRREKVCKFFFLSLSDDCVLSNMQVENILYFRSYFGFKRLTVRIIWNQSKFQSYRIKIGKLLRPIFFVALAYNLVRSAPRANYCLANSTFLANHTTARDAC